MDEQPKEDQESPSDAAPAAAASPAPAEPAPAGETLTSPTFKKPATPQSRPLHTMGSGFTLKRGRLTVHEVSDETPKRMATERDRFEEGKRSR